ncbi:MAG: GNAT family N-acetyltransferase [Gemmataceae bacterium]
MKEITTADPGAWFEALGTAPYDFYHLPQYHALAEQRGEGEARLFHYTEGRFSIALPLLLRGPIHHCAFGGVDMGNWQDATSVYGYAGPVCSHEAIPDSVVAAFGADLEETLRQARVVSVFSRLHPLLPQVGALAGLGECPEVSRTVSIDLSEPVDVQRSHYRQGYRGKIQKLQRQGVTCVYDADDAYLDDFIDIYEETMRRVGAAEMYFFPHAYYEQLRLALGPRLHVFACLHEGQPIAAALFGSCQGFFQYHLGGARDAALPLSPMRMLMDEARQWATEHGYRVFHLGGGASGRPDDSLLRFKTGFSDRTHAFRVWRWVLFPEVYRQLCQDKALLNARLGVRSKPGFFPEYRSPIVPCATAAVAEEAPV